LDIRYSHLNWNRKFGSLPSLPPPPFPLLVLSSPLLQLSIILELSSSRRPPLWHVRWLFWKCRIGERNKSHPRLLRIDSVSISFYCFPFCCSSSSFYARIIDSYYFPRRRNTIFISEIKWAIYIFALTYFTLGLFEKFHWFIYGVAFKTSKNTDTWSVRKRKMERAKSFA